MDLERRFTELAEELSDELDWLLECEDLELPL